MLQSRLLGSLNEWTIAVMTWSRLQGELAGRRTTVNIPSTSLKGRRKGEEGKENEELGKEEEKCNEGFRINTGEQREEESENGSLRSPVQSGEKTSRDTCGVEAQTLEKKRKRDDEEEASNDKNVQKQRITREGDEEERRVVSCVQNGKKGTISETDLYGSGSVCDHTTPGLDHCVVENVEHGNKMYIFFSSFISSFIHSSSKFDIFDFSCYCFLFASMS